MKGDKNPKDFVLFFAADFTVMTTTKDNTGDRKYIENMVFPTLSFPSDHGITSTTLLENPTPPTAASQAVEDVMASNPVEEQLSLRHLDGGSRLRGVTPESHS